MTYIVLAAVFLLVAVLLAQLARLRVINKNLAEVGSVTRIVGMLTALILLFVALGLGLSSLFLIYVAFIEVLGFVVGTILLALVFAFNIAIRHIPKMLTRK